MSARSRASGRQSTHSQAADPFVELMRGVFDSQRADAAALRADADRREQQMHAEFARREKDAIDKTRLQLRVEQLESEAATALFQLARPAATQRDSVTPAAMTSADGRAQPPPATADSVTLAIQSTQGDTHTLMISADKQHAHSPPPLTAGIVTYPTASTLAQSTVTAPNAHLLALSAPDSLMTDHPRSLLSSNVMPAPGGIDRPHRQLTDNFLMSAPAPLMTDYALPSTMSDMTVAAGPPRVPFRIPALATYSSMYTVDRALPAAYTVDVDHALPRANSSQFSMMTADRHDSLVPLYTAPSVVPAVTSVMPAVHTSSILGSSVYAPQAPAGAFITHPSFGPAVAFPIGAYPGWGNAAIFMRYPNPAPALPIPVMGGPTVSRVDPTSTLFGTLPTVSSLPLQTDITFTTTTAITNSAVDSVFSDLAPGLKFLALAPRSPGVATYSDEQVLPVSAAATPAVPPPTATTLAAAQQPGSATTVPVAASTFTAATPAAPAVPPESTTTSSAVPTTSATTVAVSAALPTSTVASSVVTAPPLSSSTVASSGSSTDVAVAVPSGSNPPGSMYIASTQSVTLPVIVVYSQDVLNVMMALRRPRSTWIISISLQMLIVGGSTLIN